MPVKMASFWACHSGGTAAAISSSSGPPRLSVAGMPWAGSNAVMNVRTMVRISSSGGMKDQALVSMSTRECTRSGRLRTTPMTTRPPMEWPRRSTGPSPVDSRKAMQSATSCSMV